MYRAYMMRDQVGQRFDGIVCAVTSFGVFVEIEEPYVEGLIKLESLGDEPFDYDEVHMRLSGRRTGKAIELGDKVTVEVNNVSVIRRRIDFTLIHGGTAGKTARLETAARASIPQKKKAGREVERAQRAHVERGAAPRAKVSASASGNRSFLGGPHLVQANLLSRLFGTDDPELLSGVLERHSNRCRGIAECLGQRKAHTVSRDLTGLLQGS